MSNCSPIAMTWNDKTKTLVPVSDFWARRAAKEFQDGHTYHIADQPERSTNSHRHYFSMIHDLWENLPEELAEEFPSAEALRKYALIKAGYCDCHKIPCSSQETAETIVACIRALDEYTVITITENVVSVYRAKSQSYKAMGREDFQRSKEATLGIISKLIGIAKKDANQHAGRAA